MECLTLTSRWASGLLLDPRPSRAILENPPVEDTCAVIEPRPGDSAPIRGIINIYELEQNLAKKNICDIIYLVIL